MGSPGRRAGWIRPTRGDFGRRPLDAVIGMERPQVAALVGIRHRTGLPCAGQAAERLLAHLIC